MHLDCGFLCGKQDLSEDHLGDSCGFSAHKITTEWLAAVVLFSDMLQGISSGGMGPFL